jgi:hypothetical protein
MADPFEIPEELLLLIEKREQNADAPAEPYHGPERRAGTRSTEDDAAAPAGPAPRGRMA